MGGVPEGDHERLSRSLRALGVSNRLDLLRILQVPRTVGEISLAPFRRDPGRPADRSLSRQAVEIHLQKLEGLGLVVSRAGVRGGRRVTEYFANPVGIGMLAEELRRLSLQPVDPPVAPENSAAAAQDL